MFSLGLFSLVLFCYYVVPAAPVLKGRAWDAASIAAQLAQQQAARDLEALALLESLPAAAALLTLQAAEARAGLGNAAENLN